MANEYQINEAGGAKEGYIKFSITPDLGEPVYPGDSVTISGTAYSRDFAIKSIQVGIGIEQYSSSFDFLKNVSISKGKAGKFSISFNMPEFSSSLGRKRDLFLTFWTYDKINGVYNEGGIVCSTGLGMEVKYLAYKLLINVRALDFDRANIDGSWSNEGLYFQCRRFIMSKNVVAKTSDITVAKIECKGTDGYNKDANLSFSQIESALYDEYGYFETKPTLFKDSSLIGATYTFTLTIGDEYEQVVYVDEVSRAFANIHLSGASTGGVAFGMFSTATEGYPKLESAYPAHLYGGIGEETIKLISNVIYPVGSVFFCTDEITPSDVFGGKWEQIKDRFIVAAGSSYSEGSTGGSATHSFSATHRHLSPAGFDGGLIGVVNINDSQSTGSGRPYASITATHTGNLTRNIALGYTANATVSASVDTIPPYIAICVWKRIELYDVNADMTISNTMKSVRRLSHEQLEDK